MKKYIIILLLLIPTYTTFAAEGYVVNKQQDTEVTKHNICKKIKVNDNLSCFVPTKHKIEWESFINNTPQNIGLSECVVSEYSFAYNVKYKLSIDPSVPVGTVIADFDVSCTCPGSSECGYIKSNCSNTKIEVDACNGYDLGPMYAGIQLCIVRDNFTVNPSACREKIIKTITPTTSDPYEKVYQNRSYLSCNGDVYKATDNVTDYLN